MATQGAGGAGISPTPAMTQISGGMKDGTAVAADGLTGIKRINGPTGIKRINGPTGVKVSGSMVTAVAAEKNELSSFGRIIDRSRGAPSISFLSRHGRQSRRRSMSHTVRGVSVMQLDCGCRGEKSVILLMHLIN